MFFCKRCRVNPSAYDVAGMGMCEVCAKTMNWRFKTPMVPLRGHQTVVGVDVQQAQQQSPPGFQQASLSDVGPLGVVVPALGATELLTPKGTVTDPIASIGGAQDTISDTKSGITNTAKSTAQAVSDTAKTVRTLVVIGGVIGIGVIAYTMYNAQRTTARALDILERNPDLLVKSGVLV